MRIGPTMRSVAAAAEPALNRVLTCLPASNHRTALTRKRRLQMRRARMQTMSA